MENPTNSSRMADITNTAGAIIDQLNADVVFYKQALDEKSRACKSYQWMLDDMEKQRDMWRVVGIAAMTSLVLISATSLALRYL